MVFRQEDKIEYKNETILWKGRRSPVKREGYNRNRIWNPNDRKHGEESEYYV